MIRHTGGLALGTISTKSNSAFLACSNASLLETIPTWFPSASINRTFATVIASFRRVRLSKTILNILQNNFKS
jgi:hypothetical protein